jgi:phosphoribosyl 1,2-cyclic phosphate phosphodiesterase
MLTAVTTATLRFLGAGDSQGVPRWWCRCPVCHEARTTGRNARTRPSAVIGGSETILIDAAPELRSQCLRENFTAFDAVLITHAHNDHVLGLGDVGDFARHTGRPCPIYAPAEVLPTLRHRFGYLATGRYAELTPLLALESAGRTFAGYTVTAHRVPHGFNGWAYALRFERAGATWGYMPDCLDLEDLSPWRQLDLLVLGASFYRELAPRNTRSVYDVTEATALLAELAPKHPVLTHLGHGVDAREPAPGGVRYAHDGMVLALP